MARKDTTAGPSENAVPVKLPERTSGDWGWFGERFTPRKPIAPEDKDLPYFFGSSLDFNDWLRENKPELIMPEWEIVPLDGAVGWTPKHEDESAEMCPFCLVPLTAGNASHAALRFHRIKPPQMLDGEHVPRVEPELVEECPLCRGLDAGSRLFCPKCDGSGFERKAAKQREIAGIPAPEPRGNEARRGGCTTDGESRQSPPSPSNDDADRPLTRRQRRAKQFGRADRPGEDDGRTDAPAGEPGPAAAAGGQPEA